MGITPEQYATLMKPLRPSRIAKRKQGGKELSYLEAWDVKAHLIRVFGFGNFDSELLEYAHIATREYKSGDKEMIEVVYSARVRLTVRDPEGNLLATYAEGAVGSASGPANMLGDHHDNALKTAESDALKRCAINLGTQFGLGLYDNGSTNDVVKMTLVRPEGTSETRTQANPDQQAALIQSLGAEVISEEKTSDTAAN